MFINVDLDELEVSIVSVEQPKGNNIPVFRKQMSGYFTPIDEIIHVEVIYKDMYKKDKKEGNDHIDYCLIEPDPWLVAIGTLMWQGIIQGLSWDSVKKIVELALNKLRKNGLAPGCKEKSYIYKELKIGFHWTEYSESEKMKDVFLGLHRVYNKQSKQEIEKLKEILDGNTYQDKEKIK